MDASRARRSVGVGGTRIYPACCWSDRAALMGVRSFWPLNTIGLGRYFASISAIYADIDLTSRFNSYRLLYQRHAPFPSSLNEGSRCLPSLPKRNYASSPARVAGPH